MKPMSKTSTTVKALEYHKKSEGLNKSLIDNGSKVRVARDYQNIGWVYSNLRELDQALENHYKSLHEYREINDEAGTARENSYIGCTLSKLNKHEEALEYHKRAIDIDQKISGNERWLAEDFHNLASTLFGMGDYDKALEYYKRGLEGYIGIGPLRAAYCYSGLGLVSEALSQHQEALVYHRKALEIRKRMNQFFGIAREYYFISLVFSNQSEKNKAKLYLSKAKSVLEEFERYTGYRHPISGQIQQRISYLRNLKE